MAEVTAGVTAEAWQKKILLYARKCVIMVIDIINKQYLFLLARKKQLPTLSSISSLQSETQN